MSLIKSTPLTLTTITLFSLFSTPLLAQDGEFTLSVFGGVEYDSNITVEEIDANANKSDFAGLLDFSAGYTSKINDDISFNVGYDLSQSLYFDVSEFDLQSHGLSVGSDMEVNGVDLGFTYTFFHNRLGGDSFLNMHVVSPSVAYMFGESTYVRGNYTFVDKSFKSSPDRDASTHSVGFDVYQFNEGGDFFTMGLRYEVEGALADEFDYKSFVANAGFQSKFDFNNGEAKANVGLEYVNRNYDNLTPSIAAERSDKRTTFNLDATIPAYVNINAKLAYKFINAKSNLDVADYNEHILSLSFGYSF
jgi:hypothetical protein